MSLAELRGVEFAYGARPILRGVDLALESGEVVALVGPNGSGKTTLLRLLTGELRASAGSVSVAGRPVGEWRRDGLARTVAVLPQHVELPAGFRVAELVEMGRAPHARRLFASTPDDERAVAAALRDADALDLSDRPADELSGGERQRVLIAMALAQEPRLLLLDEPTLHLDLAHQAALLGTIRRLQRQRALTVLAVLHDLNLAAAFAPRVAVLRDGRVLADGPPDGVLTPSLVRDAFDVAVLEAKDGAGRRHLALDLEATPQGP